MRQIEEYITARDSNFKDLDIAVKKLIGQGCQPFGSPYVTEGEEFLACQAMVKYVEKQELKDR